LETGANIYDSRDLSKPVAEFATSRPCHAAAFSPLEGNLFAFGDDAGKLSVVSYTDPTKIIFSESFPDFVRALSWSTKNKAVLASAWSLQDQLKLVKLE